MSVETLKDGTTLLRYVSPSLLLQEILQTYTATVEINIASPEKKWEMVYLNTKIYHPWTYTQDITRILAQPCLLVFNS